MLKKAFLLLTLTALIASLFVCATCGSDDDEDSADSISPIKLVPQNIDTLGYVNLSEIISDKDILGIYQAIPSGQIQALDMMDEVIEASGKGLKEGVFFASTASLTQAETSSYSAIIIKGKLEQTKLTEAIEAALGEALTATTYNKQQILSDASGITSLAFVGSDGLAIGATQAVKDTIDVMEGAQNSVQGDILSRYNALSGDLVKLVAILPQDMMTEDSNFELPIEIPVIGDMLSPSMVEGLQTISLSLDRKGGSLPLALALCFADTDSAKSLASQIDVIMGLAGLAVNMGMVPEGYEGLTDLLENIDVNVINSCVEIALGLPISSFKDILDIAGSGNLPF